MLRCRTSVAAVAVVAALGTASAVGVARAGGGWSRGSVRGERPRLTLFYTPPILVRSGERVRVPVDVVCATSRGSACSASLEVSERVGSSSWRSVAAGPTHQRTVDFTNPAASVAAGGSVAFSFLARSGESSLAVPHGGRAAPLRFFVTSSMPSVRIPEIPFGRVRSGSTVLFLPWGSGPMRAGLQPSRESATLGPSAFDVDGSGRIHVLDPQQRRLALFSNGHLLRQVRVTLGAHDDIAVLPSGRAFISGGVDGTVTLRRVSRGGRPSRSRIVGRGLLGEVRPAGGGAAVNLLPEDAWVTEPGDAGSSAVDRPVGLATGLLRRGGRHSIRLAAVIGGRASDAVELIASQTLAEVPLAEMVSPGDYWVIAHPYRELPARADQFEVIHVRGGRIVRAFGVADRSFADQPPMTRFRMVGGSLYQMTTSPDGMRILRFDLGRDS